jgi:hypothetical protein
MTLSRRLYANNAKTTLAAAISPYDTTISVTDGSKFPVPVAGEFFLVTLETANRIEVIEVHGRSSNIFTGCVRGREGTEPQTFREGSRAENRVTQGTLDDFEKVVDLMGDLDSVDQLDAPSKSNATAYVCHSGDANGNPVIAVRSSDSSWRFSTHGIVVITGAIDSATQNNITSSQIGNLLTNATSGKYILQFTTGINAGVCRDITGSATGVAAWSTSLGTVPAVGDQFEVYVSTMSYLKDSNQGDDALIYSLLFAN